jgi:hypothetical protein
MDKDRALVWAPTAAAVRDANVTGFMSWLRSERRLDFADYESLRRWSVADLKAFWGSIWDYVLADGVELDDALREDLARQLRAELSPRHVPDEIVAVPGIPRTLTGKKLEVPVKRIIQGWPIERAASLGAIDRPELLDWYSGWATPRTRV